VKHGNWLVPLVYFVCLVYLVERDRPDEQNKPDEPDKPQKNPSEFAGVSLRILSLIDHNGQGQRLTVQGLSPHYS